ncbi:MAG TPA: ribosome biogenesis GTPase Der [Candidatus Polarisedimenticolia bacterium]|nr:ribosome biogenesis GTPase Der [Candidatus Polarisedimenticolia bacterium]
MPQPVIAIVGAPNVGKSTLFNRMLGRRKAIVSDVPGVTRDRLMAPCDLFGRTVTFVDTGGMVEGAPDDLTRRVRAEALKAIAEADLILFVLDARAGLTALDLDVARLLRSSGRPVVPVANKIDALSLEGLEFEAYRLGLGDVVAISAEQGRGLDELVDRLLSSLPDQAAPAERAGVPMAIVGRPNVGKSSLFNRLVREERALVTPVPGTTRDPVDAVFDHAGVRYRLIDTAGIRRRAQRGEEIERVSVVKARQTLQEAEVAVAIVDASAAIEHQDLAILGMISKGRIPAVVAANKIDLLKSGGSLDTRLADIGRALGFAAYIPVIPISAKTGEGVDRLLDTLGRVREEAHRRFSTSELNRVLQEVVNERQPPSDRGRAVRFYYMTQMTGQPPRFIVFGNGRQVPEPYRRYMAGRLRARLGLGGSPVALTFRRSRPVR